MENLDNDLNNWQQQYVRMLAGMFDDGLGNAIFAALTADIQDAWQRLIVCWDSEPEKLQSILATWQSSLEVYQASLATAGSVPAKYTEDLQQLHANLKNCLNQVIDEAPNLLGTDHRLLGFATRQLVNALTIENWPLTNEKVMKKAFESNGASLVQGMQNFQEQVFNTQQAPEVKTSSEADFLLGETIALTPGEIIYQNKLFQLIQYYPFSQEVCKQPLVIIPPWINKYYVLDLTPVDSLVQWAVRQGHTVFVLSWVDPDQSLKDLDFDDYLKQGSRRAIEVALDVTQSDSVNLIGFCVGGLLAAITAGWMKRQNNPCINSLTLLNTMLDYSEPGDLGVFLSERILKAIDLTVGQSQILSGKHLRRTFMAIREDRMFWPYVVNNYLLGRDPKPNPMLYWNNDSTNLPYPMFKTYMHDFYLQNKLFNDAGYNIAGQAIKVGELDIPVFAVASKKDHIVPWHSAFSSVAPMEDVEFVLSDAGHIVGIINPPGKQRYGYWHGAITDNLSSTDEWLKDSTHKAGSWWEHWGRWILALSTEKVAARFPGAGDYVSLESAPGSYAKKTSN